MDKETGPKDGRWTYDGVNGGGRIRADLLFYAIPRVLVLLQPIPGMISKAPK